MKLAGGTVLHQKPNSNSVPAEVGVSSQPAPLPNGDGSAIRAAVAPNHRLLSRGLSRLFSHNLVGYYRHAGGQIPITHLLFADDMLIFFNVSKKSLENFLIQITLVLMKLLRGNLSIKAKVPYIYPRRSHMQENWSSKTSLVSLKKNFRSNLIWFPLSKVDSRLFSSLRWFLRCAKR